MSNRLYLRTTSLRINVDEMSSDGTGCNRVKQKHTMLQSMRLQYTNTDTVSWPLFFHGIVVTKHSTQHTLYNA